MVPPRSRSGLTLHRPVIVGYLIIIVGVLLVAQAISAQAAPGGGRNAHPVAQVGTPCPDPVMQSRFMDQWRSMIRSASGTVNPNGYLKVIGTDLIPYHSVETFMIEAPDQGHEMSSETWSYMLWLAAEYAFYT